MRLAKKTRALEGIPGAADFEVEVGAGRIAGRAHGADCFALRNVVADRNVRLVQVSVKSLRAIVVFDNNVRTVTAVPAAFARNDDLAVGRGSDRLADLVVVRRQVNRVVSVNALRFDAISYWAHVVADD